MKIGKFKQRLEKAILLIFYTILVDRNKFENFALKTSDIEYKIE